MHLQKRSYPKAATVAEQQCTHLERVQSSDLQIQGCLLLQLRYIHGNVTWPQSDCIVKVANKGSFCRVNNLAFPNMGAMFIPSLIKIVTVENRARKTVIGESPASRLLLVLAVTVFMNSPGGLSETDFVPPTARVRL